MSIAEDKRYNDDVAKAVQQAEHFRTGGPNNVLWLIVQSLKWVGMLEQAILFKLNHGSGGGASCDLSGIESRLDAIEILLKNQPVSKAGARIVVRGPVEKR